MWSYVQAWERAARALGVRIEGPVQIRVSDTLTLEADMLVHDFGACRGMLISASYDRYQHVMSDLDAMGYGFSSFGPYPDGVECTPGDMVEVLSDWGWAGPGEGPAWLIMLDAADWSQPGDFYEALLPRLNAPDWHGRNLDALWDSLTRGQINGLEPPFAVKVFNTANFSSELRDFMARAEALFADAQAGGAPVSLEVWP